MDLTYLLDHLAADPFFKKFRLLNEKIAEVVQDYSLVSFVPLNVQVRPRTWMKYTLSVSFNIVVHTIYCGAPNEGVPLLLSIFFSAHGLLRF